MRIPNFGEGVPPLPHPFWSEARVGPWPDAKDRLQRELVWESLSCSASEQPDSRKKQGAGWTLGPPSAAY